MTTEPLEPEHFDYHGHHHPYHLVDPSFWPLLGSAAALVLTGGAVWWMHGGAWWVMALGFLGTVGDTIGQAGSTVGDLLSSLQGTSLLDVDVNLDLALDLAAPINAALAANANIAAPIDAAVSANILSPDSTSLASADQNSVIVQTLQGVANATTDQASTIDQGETSNIGGA